MRNDSETQGRMNRHAAGGRRRRNDRARREERRSLRRAVLLFLALVLLFCGLVNGGRRLMDSGRRLANSGRADSFSSEYPAALVQLARDNPETEDFVRNYLEKGDRRGKIKLDESDLTGNMGSGVPLFLQWDERWGYRQYGGNYMALTGCGPTCLSMIACRMRGDSRWNPYEVAKMAEKSGYYVEGQGSAWSLMTEGAAQIGLNGQELSFDRDSVYRALQSGGMIICVMRPGDFTTSGHFLVLAGIAENGDIVVNDPNSRKRSSQTWKLDKLMPQIKNLWVYYA